MVERVDEIIRIPHLAVRGVMTMAPSGPGHPMNCRRIFQTSKTRPDGSEGKIPRQGYNRTIDGYERRLSDSGRRGRHTRPRRSGDHGTSELNSLILQRNTDYDFITKYIINVVIAISVDMVFADSLLASYFLPESKIVSQRFMTKILNPIYTPIRRLIPPLAGIDFTPLIAIILLQILDGMI